MQTTKIWMTGVAALATMGLIGCSNTAEGAKEDTQKNTQQAEVNMKEGADKMGEATRDVGAAMSLTPPIEMAIRNDETLKDSGNMINVDSSEERVTLKGHVKTEEMKKHAEEIAAKIIKDKNGKQSVYNELEVRS